MGSTTSSSTTLEDPQNIFEKKIDGKEYIFKIRIKEVEDKLNSEGEVQRAESGGDFSQNQIRDRVVEDF